MTTPRLKPGKTIYCALDSIEQSVTLYMQRTRGMSEANFRKLLQTCPDTRASYTRKCSRAVEQLRARGVSL